MKNKGMDMHSGNHSRIYLFAAIALFIIPISGLSIDIYVPSLPAVSHYFQVNKSLVQLSITTYMIGLGIMQLFAGGISDSFGRKKPFLIAMSIFIVASLFIPSVKNINQLLFLRFIQGTAVALTVVPMRAVFSDLFEGRELLKWMSYMTMAWSLGPIIAPAIGGYLQHYFGWKMNFYFLATYSIIGFLLVLIYIPETSRHYHPFHLGQILKRYISIFFHKEFALGLFIDSLLYSTIILFSVVGPFLIQTILHYSAIEFGRVSFLLGLAWFLGTMTNRIFLDIPLNSKAIFCFWSMLFISLMGLGIALFIPMNIYNIVIPILIFLWLGGTIFPNYFAKSVSLFPKTTASANALFGSFVFLISGISSGFGALLKTNNQIALMVAYVVLISLCLTIFYLDKSKEN